jgi:hypothetical protein
MAPKVFQQEELQLQVIPEELQELEIQVSCILLIIVL